MKMRKMGIAAGLVAMLSACNPDAANQPAPDPVTVSEDEVPDAMDISKGVMISSCNIERLDQQAFAPTAPEVKAGVTARISGWLVDERTKSVPAEVRLQLVAGDGSIAHEQPVVMWRDRPDVVTARGGVNEYLKSGFAVDFNFQSIGPGRYAIVLSGNDAAGPFLCDVEREVVVGH